MSLFKILGNKAPETPVDREPPVTAPDITAADITRQMERVEPAAMPDALRPEATGLLDQVASQLPQPTTARTIEADLDLARETLNQLNSQLASTMRQFEDSSSSLLELRSERELSTLGVEASRTELSVVDAHLHMRSAELDALTERIALATREFDLVTAQRHQVVSDIAVEQSNLEAARHEVSLQLSNLEQVRAAATRAEVDASIFRVEAAESVQRAEQAKLALADIEDAITLKEDLLLSIDESLRQRQHALVELDEALTRARNNLESYEASLRARVSPLETQVARLREEHREALSALQRVEAERTHMIGALEHSTGNDEDPSIAASRIAGEFLGDSMAKLQQELNRCALELDRLTVESVELATNNEAAQQRCTLLAAEAGRLLEKQAQLEHVIEVTERESTRLADKKALLEAEMYRLDAQYRAELSALEASRAESASLMEKAAQEQRRMEARRSALHLEVSTAVAEEVSKIREARGRKRRRAERRALRNRKDGGQ